MGFSWAAWTWAPGFKVRPLQEFDIGWAKMVVVEMGLRVAIHLQIITPGFYLVRSDNAGVVTVINKGHSQNAHTNDTLREIYHLQLNSHIRLKAIHVSGRDNIVDALSRGDINNFLKGFSQTTNKVTFYPPPHLSELLSLF
jgi:hypothetical protein